MMIKLHSWELQEAIEAYIKNKLKAEIDADKFDVEMIVEHSVPVWKDMKHKNGKVVRNPVHGYVEREIDRFKIERVCLEEEADFEIYLNPREEEEAS